MPEAVIVVDMLNPYDHPDAEPLKKSAAEVVSNIVELVGRARESGDLIVYVNDCHEDWAASRDDIARAALDGTAPELVEPIVPRADMPFIVKSRHSIFYGTQFEYLLRQEGIDRLIFTGQVTEQCILYSAIDAYVRRFDITVAEDCVAHIDPDLAAAALQMMADNMRAEIRPAAATLGAAQRG